VLPQIPEPARPACTHTSQKHKSIFRTQWMVQQELQEQYEQELW
jgi:hypothetical protein